MIALEEAVGRVRARFAAIGPLAAEDVALTEAHGRVLAEALVARRTQPPLDVSAMDGWAVRAREAVAGARLVPAGASAAGHPFAGSLPEGGAIRVFTGAAIPAGADTVLIQENARIEEDRVRVLEAAEPARHIRRAGLDFRAGETVIERGRLLGARDIGLAAGLGHVWLAVRRRPRIAVLATGDEIVRPGDPAGPADIIGGSSYALAAMIRQWGGDARLIGIARDQLGDLRARAGAAAGFDLLVTTGGASVGAHDLVREALGTDGLSLDFWKIAMRPGKPLMFGDLNGLPVIGLPGNPVSTIVCALIFIRPAIDLMLGRDPDRPRVVATLAAPLGANDQRRDFLRARSEPGLRGERLVRAFDTQDSSLTRLLAEADCLIIRAPHAPAAAAGSAVDIIDFASGE